MNLYWHSIKQSHQDWLETIKTKRLGVIVQDGDLLLMEKNTNPGYNNMTSFLNTTLSKDIDEVFSLETLQRKPIDLVSKRTGYNDLRYLKTLSWSIERSFHKPDKNHNETWIYKDSILVFELISDNKKEIDPSEHRESQRHTRQELDELLQADGSNGSSYLIKRLFDSQQENA